MFRIEMATDSPAFVAAPGAEIASILEGLAGEMASVDDFVGDCQGVLKDLNGNKVGMWQYIDETEGQEMHQDYNPEEDTVDKPGEDCGQPWVAENKKCPRCGLDADGHRAWKKEG